ncbi:MAG: helix-turn-helix domain-containing protein [Candidatus Methylacidiphilales bacterium]
MPAGESSMDLEQMHELCRLRSTLEAFAAERLRTCPARLDTTLIALSEKLQQMLATARDGDYPRFHEIDRQFHRTLVTSGALASLTQSWQLVMDELDCWLRHVKTAYWPNLMTLYREHELLLAALKSEEKWVPAQALHQHLEAGWFRVASMQPQQGSGLDWPAGSDPVDRASAFISTHFASRFSMEEVASHVSFVSTGHMNRLFRQKLGISPHGLLKQVRLERGAELLISGAEGEIAVVAAKVGYKSVSHFIRDFRLHFKCTPRAYRQQRVQKEAAAG